jgi:hypothetical protein
MPKAGSVLRNLFNAANVNIRHSTLMACLAPAACNLAGDKKDSVEWQIMWQKAISSDVLHLRFQ